MPDQPIVATESKLVRPKLYGLMFYDDDKGWWASHVLCSNPLKLPFVPGRIFEIPGSDETPNNDREKVIAERDQLKKQLELATVDRENWNLVVSERNSLKKQLAEAQRTITQYHNDRETMREERDAARKQLEEVTKEKDQLRCQFPVGMENCTFIYRECEHGHGWLTAKNWLAFGCPTCDIARLKGELAEVTADRDKWKADFNGIYGRHEHFKSQEKAMMEVESQLAAEKAKTSEIIKGWAAMVGVCLQFKDAIPSPLNPEVTSTPEVAKPEVRVFLWSAIYATVFGRIGGNGGEYWYGTGTTLTFGGQCVCTAEEHANKKTIRELHGEEKAAWLAAHRFPDQAKPHEVVRAFRKGKAVYGYLANRTAGRVVGGMSYKGVDPWLQYFSNNEWTELFGPDLEAARKAWDDAKPPTTFDAASTADDIHAAKAIHPVKKAWSSRGRTLVQVGMDVFCISDGKLVRQEDMPDFHLHPHSEFVDLTGKNLEAARAEYDAAKGRAE